MSSGCLLDFWIINSTTVSQAGLWAFHGPTFWGSKAADCRGGQTGNTPSRHHKLKLHPLMNIKSHIIQTSIPGMSLSQSKISTRSGNDFNDFNPNHACFWRRTPYIWQVFFFGGWVEGHTSLRCVEAWRAVWAAWIFHRSICYTFVCLGWCINPPQKLRFPLRDFGLYKSAIETTVECDLPFKTIVTNNSVIS